MGESGILCHVYTRARKHPKLTGVIGGHVMPFVSTNTQLTVTIGSTLLLLKLHRFWAFLPPLLQLVLVVVVPVGAWFGVRHWQPDDRSPLRFTGAFLAYVLRPRGGRRNGRPVHINGRGVSAGGHFFFSGS